MRYQEELHGGAPVLPPNMVLLGWYLPQPFPFAMLFALLRDHWTMWGGKLTHALGGQVLVYDFNGAVYKNADDVCHVYKV